MAVAALALAGGAALGGMSGIGAAAAVSPLLCLPVRIHLMQSSAEPALQTTLTAAEVPWILSGVNKIWAQAGVRFDIESVVATRALDSDPVLKDPKNRWMVRAVPKSSRAGSAIDVCYVKNIVANGFYSGALVMVKDAPALQSVPGGTGEPLARVTSHELGHALGLSHRQNITNLMSSKTTGFSLSEAEIARARAGAMKRKAGEVPVANESGNPSDL